MDYVNATEAARRSVGAEPGDLSGVHRGLELVLAAWRLHAGAGNSRWDVLGAVAQEIAEEFHHLPPVVYGLTDGGDPVKAWQQSVQLAKLIADRLDDVASEPGIEKDRAWWAATAAARLRTAVPVQP